MLYMSSSATQPYRILNLGYGPFSQSNLHKLELVNVRMAGECAMTMMLMSNPKLQHLSIPSCHVKHAG